MLNFWGLYFCSKCRERKNARCEDPFPYCTSGLNSTWFPMEDSPKTHDSNGSLQLNIEKKYEDKPTTPTHTQNISQPPVVYSSQTWPAMDVALQRPPVVATPPLPRRRIAAAHELGRITGTWHAAIHGSLDQESTSKFFQMRNAQFFKDFCCSGWKQNSTYKFIFYLLCKENQLIFSKSQRIKKTFPKFWQTSQRINISKNH